MTTILIKKKDTAGAPAAGDLTNAAGGAEIAVNTATKRIYTKDSGGNVVETGTNPSILNVDNIQIDVNTISSTDTNGNINLTPNGTGSVVISKLNVTGAITFDGNVTVGNSSSDTLTVNSTITSNLIFTDNTYDIGASGATRPRSIFLAGNATVGGLTSGRVTYAGTGGLLTDSANLQFDGTNLSVGIAPSAGVQLYVYAPASTNAQVRIAVPTATQATYISFVNTTVTKIGTENSVGGALASGSSAYATILSNNTGYPVQVGTNNVIRTTVDSSGRYGINTPTPNTTLHVNQLGDSDGITLGYTTRGSSRIVWELSGVTNQNTAFFHDNGTDRQILYLMGRSEFVVNDDGVDMDFRVESDADTHMLFVDAGNNRVGIRTGTPGDVFEVYGSGSGSGVRLNNMGTTNGGRYIYDNAYFNIGALGSSGAPYLGYAVRAEYAAGNTYVSTTAVGVGRAAIDVGAGGNGNIRLWTGGPQTPASGSALTDWSLRLTVDPDGNWTQNSDGGTSVVFNSDGVDQDFRVASDTNTHALFVDAGNSRVGVNNSNPSVPLDVNGIVRVGFQLNQVNPVQNTWYDIIGSMVDNSSWQVSIQAIKGSNEEFAIYQSLQVVGTLNSSTRTAYYVVGAGAGLEYRILSNYPSPNSMQVRCTTSGVSALRASVIQMGG